MRFPKNMANVVKKFTETEKPKLIKLGPMIIIEGTSQIHVLVPMGCMLDHGLLGEVYGPHKLVKLSGIMHRLEKD